jgi:molecular chaperone GrpE
MSDTNHERNDINKEQEPENEERKDEIIEGEVVEEGESNGGEGEAAIAHDYSELAEELQQAQDKAKEFFEGWQRERADFANYKKRIDRDQQSFSQNIKGDVIKKYLVILDDLQRALKTRPTEGPAESWASGIELITRKLQNILESEGIKRIPAENEQFDPSRQEAITYEESPDHKTGEIIEVVQEGYTLGDRVLRPALVRVAR